MEGHHKGTHENSFSHSGWQCAISGAACTALRGTHGEWLVLAAHASALCDALGARLRQSGGIHKSNGATLALGLCLVSLLSLAFQDFRTIPCVDLKNVFS